MSHAPSTEQRTEIDLTGRELGGYRLLRRLGRGAMAEVYLAEQTSLRRQIALKVLKRDLATDHNYVKRFHMEAQAAASLVHANIVQIHEVGCVDGIHFIAQEYVAGQNLCEYLTRRGSPDLKLAISIMRQVAAALAKAADHGIVHRDIKPENIMLTKAGEVKVADFGLARVTTNGDALNLTQVGVTMGTPLYMSPEQVEGRPLDPRSDIYALGVTCYHLLSGQPPFRGDTALAVALQHLRTQPERLENSRSDLPTGLCRIVHRMLAKDPAQRYEHARELIRELRALQQEQGFDQAAGDEDLSLNTETAGQAPKSASAAMMTQELAALMKTQTLLQTDRRWIGYLLAGTIAAFLLGVGLAFAMREPALLAGSNGASIGQPRQPTAEAQYESAMLAANSAAAWKAVFEFFPNDTKYGSLAKKQLASLYLQRGENDQALPLFEELSKMTGEAAYQAFGLAGLCVINAIEGDDIALNARLLELNTLTSPGKMSSAQRANILDPHMMRLIQVIMTEKKQQFEESTRRATDQLLDSLNLGVDGKSAN